jgi:sugar phosphate isomerase/epimerase
MYAPHWSPVDYGYRHLTLDLSHSAVARGDTVALYEAMGDQLVHVHMADGIGLGKDEHLVPGRGTQPCGEILGRLAERRFAGSVIVEINTRRAVNRACREEDLAEALAYTRLHLAARAQPVG